jgi:pimeloyl-ACP methyl ester carboxylesterase
MQDDPAERTPMTNVTHATVDCNGIRMHVAECGSGPLVLLCHGFPESWRTWRHQIPALAGAGWRVAAPDMRGYGQTDRPEAIAAYNIFDLVGDMVGLVHALGEQRAVIVGHDWGASVAQHTALMRPDVFHAVALLSVPFDVRAPGGVTPTVAMQHMAPGKVFYQYYFQQPGKAESELEVDIRDALLCMLYSASGSAPVAHRWRFLFDAHEKLLDSVSRPDALPGWLAVEDLDFLSAEFGRTGFRGGLNYYRNLDFNWAHTRQLIGARIHQPSLFIGGDVDGSVLFRMRAYERLEQAMPGLTRKVLLPGIGHWTPEEAPAAVNDLLLQFLAPLRRAATA